MGIPTKLAQAKRLAVYWDNYINYLSTLDDRQPGVGQGKPKPPQTKLYIKPFSLTLDTDQFLEGNGTSSRWGTFQTHFVNRTKDTLNTSGGEISLNLKRFTPARIVIKTGMSTTKTVATAKTTKRKYITYGGESGSIPFGRNTTEAELDAYNTIKTAIEGDNTNFDANTMRVSRIKEKN